MYFTALFFLVRLVVGLCGSCPEGLISFGDSLSDTGNVHRLFPSGVPRGFPSGEPYGITWPGFDAGRSSDGKLIVDYLAEEFGLGDHAVPYFSATFPDFRTTINFAQTGATARITSFENPFHLMLQVEHFLQFKDETLTGAVEEGTYALPSTFFRTFLYFILIGGNDINHNLKPEFAGLSPAEVESRIIPETVDAIVKAIEVLHEQGGRKFLVLGRPPQGCTPLFKTLYASNTSTDYDSHGCLRVYNNLTLTLDIGIQRAVGMLRRRYRDSEFFFADLYNSFIEIRNNAETYGFTNTAHACCGGGKPFNFSPSRKCGSSGATVCSDPAKFISWDGNHFTQQYYKTVANLLLSGKFLDPPVNLHCKDKHVYNVRTHIIS